MPAEFDKKDVKDNTEEQIVHLSTVRERFNLGGKDTSLNLVDGKDIDEDFILTWDNLDITTDMATACAFLVKDRDVILEHGALGFILIKNRYCSNLNIVFNSLEDATKIEIMLSKKYGSGRWFHFVESSENDEMLKHMDDTINLNKVVVMTISFHDTNLLFFKDVMLFLKQQLFSFFSDDIINFILQRNFNLKVTPKDEQALIEQIAGLNSKTTNEEIKVLSDSVRKIELAYCAAAESAQYTKQYYCEVGYLLAGKLASIGRSELATQFLISFLLTEEYRSGLDNEINSEIFNQYKRRFMQHNVLYEKSAILLAELNVRQLHSSNEVTKASYLNMFRVMLEADNVDCSMLLVQMLKALDIQEELSISIPTVGDEQNVLDKVMHHQATIFDIMKILADERRVLQKQLAEVRRLNLNTQIAYETRRSSNSDVTTSVNIEPGPKPT